MTDKETTASDRNPDIVVDGIRVHIDGDGPGTIVMLHGWPDTWRLWDRQVEHFAPRWRCVRFTFPGFDRDGPPGGFTLDEVGATLGRVVDAVSPHAPVVLMLHDWGAIYGYAWALRHPQRVARVVGVDIGDAQSRAYRRSLTLRSGLIIAGYQLWLVLAWRLGRLGLRGLADAMTRGMARWMGCRSDPAPIGWQMNYPYDASWTGSFGGLRRLPALEPPWPMFFAWGTAKPMMFHSGEWVQALTRDPRHRAMAFDCGHWVMRSRAQAFNAAVEGWLGEASSAGLRRPAP